MIKIYENKIQNLSVIKGKHVEAVKEIVKAAIEKFEYNIKDKIYELYYVKSESKNKKRDNKDKNIKNSIDELKAVEEKTKTENKKKLVEFNEADKKLLETFLGITVNNDNEKISVKFNDNFTNISKIAEGQLKSIFQLYFNSIKSVEELKEYNIKEILIANYHIKEIIKKIKNDNLNGNYNEDLKKRKENIYEYIEIYKCTKYLDEEFFIQYNKLQKSGYSKVVSNKSEFEKYFSLNDEYNKVIYKVEKLNDILKYIFDYDVFKNGLSIIYKGKQEKWGRHNLITMLGVNVCPYCNRQYISYYNDAELKKTTADLDHFYLQSNYPFLSLSLYNFIPSCQICNSRFKLQKDFYFEEHIYPYEEGFGEAAKFKTDFYTDEDIEKQHSNGDSEEIKEYDMNYLLGNSNNFKIEIKPKSFESKLGEKIQNSINTFHLEELYNFHKDYIREFIKKTIIYNESRIEELYTQYPQLFNSREEVLQMVLSNYIGNEELGKRPLAKLMKDICEEFGLKY